MSFSVKESPIAQAALALVALVSFLYACVGVAGTACTLFGVKIFDLPDDLRTRIAAFSHPNPNTPPVGPTDQGVRPDLQGKNSDLTIPGENKNTPPIGSSTNIPNLKEQTAVASVLPSDYLENTSSPTQQKPILNETQKNEVFMKLNSDLHVYKMAIEDYYGQGSCLDCRATRQEAYKTIKQTVAMFDNYSGAFEGNASAANLMDAYRPYIEKGRDVLRREQR